jgi:hypothetical protein
MSPKRASVIPQHVSAKALIYAIKARQAVMLVGDPGTAKTATVEAIAREMGYEVISVIASRMDPQDVSGFPTRGEVETAEGTVPVTEYAPQKWQLEVMKKKKVILFFDEFSNAHPSVRASLLTVIQNREFPNGQKFPEETALVGAMNPTESAADGYDIDAATANRIVWLAWKPDTKSWLDGMKDNWGRGFSQPREKEWRSLIVRFIKENPGCLHQEGGMTNSPDAYGVNVNDASALTVLQCAWPSRRSWDNLSRVLGAMSSPDIELEDVLMQGIIGYSTTLRFRDWLRKNGSLDIKTILKNPDDFEEWEEMTLDDANMVLRSLRESLTEDTDEPMQRAKAVIKILHIFADLDKCAYVVAHLKPLVAATNKLKGLTTAEKSEVKTALIQVAKRYAPALSERGDK